MDYPLSEQTRSLLDAVEEVAAFLLLNSLITMTLQALLSERRLILYVRRGELPLLREEDPETHQKHYDTYKK